MDHTAHRFLFADRRPVTVGGGQVLWSTHIGKVRISDSIVLNNVLLIPHLGCNLVPVLWLLQSGYSVNFSKSACSLGLITGGSSSPSSTSALATAPYTKGLHTLVASYHPPSSGSAYAVRSVANQVTYWHYRLGYLNFHEVMRMRSGTMYLV
jgi:hypothetical protein